MSALELKELIYRVTVSQVKPRRCGGLWPEKWEAAAEYRDPNDRNYSGMWRTVYESLDGAINTFRMSRKTAWTPDRAKRKAEKMCARHLAAWHFKVRSEATTTIHISSPS